jgi:LysM repeat protein
MGQNEYLNLVALIKQRAKILKKMKTAKGEKLKDLEEDLKITNKYIKMLDEKQK